MASALTLAPSYTIREKSDLKHYQRLKSDFKYFFIHLAAPIALGEFGLFKPSRGFEVMAEYGVAMLEGEIKRLAISIPPRNAKSLIFSTALPLWQWLSHSNDTFISVAHHDSLLHQFQSGRQGIFNSLEYQNSIDWQVTTNTKDTLRNTAGGHMLSMVLTHVVTGLGGNNLIVDDPIPARDSGNIKACEKAWDLYTGTLLSRLNDKKEGKICVVSQRLCDADIIGHVTDAGYTALTLQAIADEPQTIIFPLSGLVWEREKGDVLNPDYEPLEVLMEIKRTDEKMFQAQYQQRPTAIKGSFINTDNLGRFKAPRGSYQDVIISVDSAASTTRFAANWGITVFGKYMENGLNCLDLLYCHANKYEYPEGLAKIKQLGKQFEATKYMIENKSTGLAIIPTLKQEGFDVIQIEPIKSKEDRTISAIPFLHQGRLRVPDTSMLPFTERWLSIFLYELDSFGGGARSKDILDSTTQCINFYSNNSFNPRNFFRLKS
jgi:hypothetical protein